MTEELCVNTAKYAVSSHLDMVDIFLKITDDSVILKVRDKGKIFNPTEYIDDSGKLVMGLSVVRRLTPDISYNRVLGFNITVVTAERYKKETKQKE